MRSNAASRSTEKYHFHCKRKEKKIEEIMRKKKEVAVAIDDKEREGEMNRDLKIEVRKRLSKN